VVERVDQGRAGALGELGRENQALVDRIAAEHDVGAVAPGRILLGQG